MKKTVVVMLALLLAIPAVSWAGSATSRWDLTIGGTIKLDVGWADRQQTTLSAGGAPGRDAYGGTTDVGRKYGNWLWGDGESSLNFMVKGPDAWGAKTSSAMIIDMTGFWGGSNYRSLDLLLANFTFDWANTSLMLGSGGSVFGQYAPPFGSNIAWGGMAYGDKGAAPIALQATLTQRFGKNWTAKFGVMQQQNIGTGLNSIPGGAPTTYTRSPIPGFQGLVQYSSDACGKVGPWQLTFGTSGFWGQEKRTYTDSTGSLSDKQVNMWLADFKWIVPIIPEKNGNKGGALYFDGIIWTGQNMDGYFGGWGNVGTNSYQRAGISTSGDFASPVSAGGMVHASYYFTDQVYLNGIYWYSSNGLSKAQARIATNDGVKSEYQYIASLGYDVNPAIKLMLQWDFTKANYIIPSSTLKQSGTANNYRLAAYYYF